MKSANVSETFHQFSKSAGDMVSKEVKIEKMSWE